MKIRRITALFLSALLLLNMAGCQMVGQEKEKVTIYLRNYADHKGLYEENEPGADYDSMTRYMADQFIAQYDKYDVTIVTEYFTLDDEPKFVEGKYGQPDATDVVLQDSFVNLGHIYEGRVIPLNDVLPEQVRDEVGPEFDDLYSIGGKYYMAPYGRLPTLFVYNAELFRKAGLEEYIAGEDEISDWTIDEWNTILAALKENLPETVYPMMMYGGNVNGDMVNMMLLRMFGNPFFDENGNACINDENGIKALRWIQDNHRKGYYPPGAENLDLLDCFELFCNNQLVIYFSNNVLNRVLKELNLDTRYALYPSVKGRGMSFDFTYSFAVFDNGDEKRLEVSKDFLKFLYSNEELLALSTASDTLPAFSGIAQQHKDTIPMMEQWRSIEDTRIDFTNRSPNYPGIRNAFYPEMTALLAGEQTPEETAKRLDENINAAIEKGRAEGKLHD